MPGQDSQPIEDASERNIPDFREDALGLVFYGGSLYDGLVDSQLLLRCNKCLTSPTCRFPIIAEILEDELPIEDGNVKIGDVLM